MIATCLLLHSSYLGMCLTSQVRLIFCDSRSWVLGTSTCSSPPPSCFSSRHTTGAQYALDAVVKRNLLGKPTGRSGIISGLQKTNQTMCQFKSWTDRDKLLRFTLHFSVLKFWSLWVKYIIWFILKGNHQENFYTYCLEVMEEEMGCVGYRLELSKVWSICMIHSWLLD